MGNFLLFVVLLLFAIAIIQAVAGWLKTTWNRISPRRYTNIFDRGYIEGKAFYMQKFGIVPCSTSSHV